MITGRLQGDYGVSVGDVIAVIGVRGGWFGRKAAKPPATGDAR